MELLDCNDELIEAVLGCAICVHKTFGPGLLESVYERALLMELESNGIRARRQVEIPLTYRGKDLGAGFKADLIVEERLLLELKVVDEVSNIHVAQVITYLKLLQYKRGFILNFNVQLLKQGIKRISI